METWNKGMKFPYKPKYKLRGRTPWNKGLTKETDRRVKRNAESGRENKRLAHLGSKHTKERKENISKSLKGKKKSKKHRKNLSISLKKGFASGKIRKSFLGKHHTEETKKYLKKIHKGQWKLDKNPKWKGGKTFEIYGIEWNDKLKEQIRKRDNYTCQICGEKQNKKKLDVHHIDKNKKNNNPKNLISLCHYCHILIHNNKKNLFRCCSISKSISTK